MLERPSGGVKMWLSRCALAALAALLYAGPTAAPPAARAALFGALLVAAEARHFVFLLYHTLGRDLRAAKMMLGLVTLVKKAEWRDWNVSDMFAATVTRLPDKVMLYFKDEAWTFKQVDEYSNRIANVFKKRGYAKGDIVALFMENRPEYVGIWLGLAKIGVIPALINTNLKKDSLLRSIGVVEASTVIYGTELDEVLLEALPINGSSKYTLFASSKGGEKASRKDVVDLDAEAEAADSSLPTTSSMEDRVGFNDKLMFIYTSGTTGLPKAALIKHSRYILASGGCGVVMGVHEDDVVYAPLPLYHSVAGMVTLAGAMNYGFSLVMRKKFSANAYWSDCVKYGVTCGQYIGEICRYLLNTPQHPDEKRHSVRLMMGNGLRPQIWNQFCQRFGIANIAEFYGSTEGNSQIINNENRVGAVGFVSLLFPNILPLGLIKIDEETGHELRNEKGLCIPCQPGEPGEFVGKIVRNHPVRDFHGYADNQATNKKLLRDVRKRGDLYFRSGDVLVMDELGWLYFRDRAGDTFRWKGENVSTTEVEATISGATGLADAVVYGVTVPNTEGRAGMAAIHDPYGKVDLETLAADLLSNLPRYAVPMFVRLKAGGLEMTGTFKLKKFNLQKEGFDPMVAGRGGDRLFFLASGSTSYAPLTRDLFDDIVAGRIRL